MNEIHIVLFYHDICAFDESAASFRFSSHFSIHIASIWKMFSVVFHYSLCLLERHVCVILIVNRTAVFHCSADIVCSNERMEENKKKKITFQSLKRQQKTSQQIFVNNFVDDQTRIECIQSLRQHQHLVFAISLSFLVFHYLIIFNSIFSLSSFFGQKHIFSHLCQPEQDADNETEKKILPNHIFSSRSHFVLFFLSFFVFACGSKQSIFCHFRKSYRRLSLEICFCWSIDHSKRTQYKTSNRFPFGCVAVDVFLYSNWRSSKIRLCLLLSCGYFFSASLRESRRVFHHRWTACSW